MTDTIDTTGPRVDDIPLHHSLPAVAVHTAFRREFRLAGPLVRHTTIGDVARAHAVARHLDFLLRGLHHHHQIEEELVVPIVRSRASVSDCRHVDVMQAQHDAITGLATSIAVALPIWRAHASARSRDQLDDLLEALHDRLVEHLDVEERFLLPLAERHLVDDDWAEIGRRAEAGNRGRERILMFGMIQYEGDPAVLASMIAQAPAPVRRLVPFLARLAYRRYADQIHGTPTP